MEEANKKMEYNNIAKDGISPILERFVLANTTWSFVVLVFVVVRAFFL